MSYEYPDDGHIYVCVRVRDVATVPGMALPNNGGVSATRRSTRENIKDAQRICVSTIENVVVLHDPKSVEDASCVARDADGVVQLLTARSSGGKEKRLARKLLTATATANYFEFDRCLNSMETGSMMQMPMIRNSDFIQPPEYGTQEDVYLCTAVHAVTAAVEGINSCVFAYGQTGSGKTFTLFGDTASIRRDPGVVPRTLDDLFQRLECIKREYESDTETEYSCRVQLSFFEIYQNEVYCLFSRKGPLRVNFSRDIGGKEETMVIHDLQQQVVSCAEKAYPLVEMGLRRRQTGETGMNARSSRSHAILQVRLTQWRTNRITKESVELNATINLVDLAGSERQKTAKTDGKSRDEGIQINQSLATLARVINEISRGAKYVNYRDSLLTMVLKDNLGGNSKTFMVATIAPMTFCYQESCATLQYAKDVRKIRNRPMVNKTFQTRSNLLDLNARLKQENEMLKGHIESLLKNLNGGADNSGTEAVAGEGGGEEGGDPPHHGKVSKALWGSSAAAHVGPAAAETVIAASGVGAVPLVITAHRKYTSLYGIGGSCVEGGRIGVTSLTKGIVKFRLADLLDDAQKSDPQIQGDRQKLSEERRDYGVVEFERVSQRSCEQHYWMRYLPNEEAAATALGCRLECHVNGASLRGGSRRQMMHGDVVCIYLDSLDGATEQSLLSFHYVDLNCLSRRDTTTGDLKMTVSLPRASAERASDDDLEQLQRDKAKLLEMVQTQARTIEYQCQRDAESRSRMASVTHYRGSDKDGSPSPNPVMPLERINMDVPATTPLQASAAARAFYRTSVSPSIQYELSANPQRYEDCVRENQTLYKGMVQRNATLEELARRLAELERSTSQQQNAPALPEGPSTFLKTTTRVSKKGVSSEVSESEDASKAAASSEGSPTGVMTETHNPPNFAPNDTEADETQKATAAENTTSIEAAKTVSEAEQPPNADEILLKHRADPDLEQFGRMNVFLSTSDGVRERYYAAKREHVLCERIWSLEQALENLRGEMHLLESNLRIAQDANTEHEFRQAQMEDEMTEVSKALLDATEENGTLLRDINALETFLGRTEEALAEASAINEVELEKRIVHMAEEIRALKTVARMWKRRAMQRIAREFGDNHNNKEGDEVVIKSGQVPWEDLRVESNAARAKQLLGDARCTATATNTIDRFEKETAAEAVVALETVLAELESENLRLIDDIKVYEEQLRDYKELVARLRREKEQIEEEGSKKGATDDEMQKFKELYVRKCEELAAAERQYETAATKLKSAVQKNTAVKKKSATNNDLLLQEQRRIIEEQRGDNEKLGLALASKDEELRTVLRFLQARPGEAELGGFKDDVELRNRIEELLEAAMGDTSSVGAGYSVFPPDFVFSEEVVALIRVCLRIMMDRLKIELYVLNRQSLHKLGLFVPAVQLRPEAQFHSFMHELRGVVAEIAGKPQRIGGKWTVEEGDVLSRLIDHRRRRAGNALSGLLIWYDHWDLSPKSEHVCYMELIRNMERVMQLARLVRQESLVNTNATSTLRLMMPGKNGAPDTTYMPANITDTSINESRRILEKLTVGARRSNLARVVTNSKPAASAGFQRSRTAISAHSTPRKSDIAAVNFARTATFTPKSAMKTPPAQQQQQQEQGSHGTDSKFGRRATALVVPVTENDITFAASTALARYDSTFNFARRMSAVNLPEAEPHKQPTKTTRFARAKTDVPPSFAALAELRNGKPSDTSTGLHSVTPKSAASRNNSGSRTPIARKTTTRATPGETFRRTRTAQFSRMSTSGVPQLSSRVSGRRPMVATTTAGAARTSTSHRPKSPKPAVPVAPKSFYDPSVLKTLKQRSSSESNQMPEQQGLRKLSKSRPATPTRVPAVVLPRRSSSLSLSSRLHTKCSSGRSTTSHAAALPPPVPVPRLCFDSLPL